MTGPSSGHLTSVGVRRSPRFSTKPLASHHRCSEEELSGWLHKAEETQELEGDLVSGFRFFRGAFFRGMLIMNSIALGGLGCWFELANLSDLPQLDFGSFLYYQGPPGQGCPTP